MHAVRYGFHSRAAQGGRSSCKKIAADTPREPGTGEAAGCKSLTLGAACDGGCRSSRQPCVWVLCLSHVYALETRAVWAMAGRGKLRHGINFRFVCELRLQQALNDPFSRLATRVRILFLVPIAADMPGA